MGPVSHVGSLDSASRLDSSPWLSLAGGPDSTAPLGVMFGQGTTVYFRAVDLVSSLLFCWSCLVESVLGRVVSHLDYGCLDTLPLAVILLSLC